MRKITIVILATALALAGCAEPMSRTQRGTAIGAGTGAAVGAGLGQLIGGDTRSTLLGAGVGAALGGVTGGTFSNYMEKQEQEMRRSLASVEGASIERDAQNLAVTFKSDLLFDVDSSEVKAGGYDELKRVADVLNAYPQTRLQIAGHTDSTGAEVYNQRLSERRAEAVKGILINYQVAPQRIRTIGFGQNKPIASNATLGGRQMNRRVSITIEPLQQVQNNSYPSY